MKQEMESLGCSTTRHMVVFPARGQGTSFTIDIGGQDPIDDAADEPECKWAASKDDIARANRLLRGLGFKRAWAEEGVEVEGKGPTSYREFKKNNYEFSYADEAAKILRGGRVLAEDPGDYAHLVTAHYVPVARIVVYTLMEAAGDCADYDPQRLETVELPDK